MSRFSSSQHLRFDGIASDLYIQCLGESYYAPYFFPFFVSGQPSSVNDIQGIRLHKLPKTKLLRATKCGEGLHIRGIISAPTEGY